jgi:hypothetical protein
MTDGKWAKIIYKFRTKEKKDSIPVSSPKIYKSLRTVSIKMESENVLLTLK